MDFSEAVFSEMSRVLSYMNAGCYVNIINDLAEERGLGARRNNFQSHPLTLGEEKILEGKS